jgi:predicted  nucleic acid-binding Zn-ribbon protein
MDIITNREQFAYQKTLADIGVQIAKGRAEISELAQKKQDYLEKQEAEALVKVQGILNASVEALGQAAKNQDLLVSWKNELESFAVELTSWNEKLTNQQQDFEAKSANIMANISVKTAELNKLSTTTKALQSMIESNRQENDKRNLALNAKEKLVNDRYQTLLKTEKEIKK